MNNDNLKCVGYRGVGGIRQTAKAPVDLRICGGFTIYVDGGVDGSSFDPFRRYLLPFLQGQS